MQDRLACKAIAYKICKSTKVNLLSIRRSTDLCTYAEASGLLDGKERLWERRDLVYKVKKDSLFKTSSLNIVDVDDLSSSELLDRISPSGLYVYDSSINTCSTELIQSKMSEANELPIDYLDDKQLLEILTEAGSNESLTYLVEASVSKADFVNAITKLVTDYVEHNTDKLLMLLKIEAKELFDDYSFSYIRKVIKSKINKSACIRSKQDLIDYIANNRHTITAKIPNLSVETLCGYVQRHVEASFTHEAVFRSLTSYLGTLSHDTIVPLKLVGLSNGILINIYDAFVSCNDVTHTTGIDLAIYPKPSSNTFDIIFVPRSGGSAYDDAEDFTNVVTSIHTFMAFLSSKLGGSRISNTQIYGIPLKNLDYLIQILFDAVTEPGRNIQTINSFPGVVATNPPVDDAVRNEEDECEKFSSSYAFPVERPDSEYYDNHDLRATGLTISKIGTPKDDFNNWISENSSIVITPSGGLAPSESHATLGVTRRITIVDDGNHGRQQRSARCLSGNEIKNILAAFKSISKDKNILSLAPTVPLNATKEIKIKGLARCVVELANLCEDLLKEFLKTMVSDNGNPATFVCEINPVAYYSRSYDSSRWTAADEPYPKVRNFSCSATTFSAYLQRFTEPTSAMYTSKKADLTQQVLDVYRGLGSSNSRYIFQIVLVVAINRFLENGVMLTPAMNVNKFSSTINVAENIISNGCSVIELNGFHPLSMSNISHDYKNK